ncbi:hypothetical protein FACS1894109_00440 [Spirochaetia bacterium]|nr:hypothetical protein FACS1894109_00440 [Spirochaetia bacterium]
MVRVIPFLEEFLEERILKCTPIITSFHTWLEKQSEEVLPSSALGAAIKYTLNRWPTLAPGDDWGQLLPWNLTL